MRIRPMLAIPLLASALSGCADDTTTTPTPPVVDDLLAPPAAGHGVQYSISSKIEAGQEVEHCKFVRAPPEGLDINRDEVRYSPGSHHVLVYETPYTEMPTTKKDGTPFDASAVFDCSAGVQADFAVVRMIGGSQNGSGDSFVKFPAGVAMHVEPNKVLMLNAHYLNATSGPLEPEVRINLHTIPKEEVKQVGDVLFIYNVLIDAPAQGKSQARMRCPIRSDITVTNFQSHMHKRGVGYGASIDGGDPFYTNTEWENVPVKEFADGFQLKAGSVLDYHCDYNNTTANDIYAGATTKDEMCMAIGSYYPIDISTSLCPGDPANASATFGLGGEWVGVGAATCKETLGCLQGAFTSADVRQEVTKCVTGADPGVAKEVSDVVRCLFLKKDPALCMAEAGACAAK